MRASSLRPAPLAAAAAVVAAALCLPPGTAGASGRAGAEQVLHSFAGPDGAGPESGVTAGPGGVLYGTTAFGGRYSHGCVFALTPHGSGYTERVLFSFHGPDGYPPGGNVALGAHGDLIGDTVIGGAHGNGNVFELVPGGGGYTEKVLYSFTGGADGSQPLGTPVLGAHGDIFGVTQAGGAGGQGGVFELKASAAGYAFTALHSFSSAAGGSQAGLAIASDGTLYGTLYGLAEVHIDGGVFRLRLGKTGAVYTDLYNFKGGADGNNPYAALTVDNRTGVIYGTTQDGGTPGTDGSGTVFSLTPHGSGYTERVLAALPWAGNDGYGPGAPVLLTASGDLFSTASGGGTRCDKTGCGTLFELVPAGSAYTFRMIHRFTGPPDGAEVDSGVIEGPGGELLGTTTSGGAARCYDGGPGGVLGCGTVYEAAP